MKEARPVRQLRQGDYIGLFSPSEPLTIDRQERMRESLTVLEATFRPTWAPNALASDYYQAGTRRERSDDIENLISDVRIGGMLATWGGKNCSQLIPFLPYDKIAERRIPIMGFSDTGVILTAITAKSNLVTFYGPNIAGKLLESQHADFDLARGESVPPFGVNATNVWSTITEGAAEGILVGGNLSTFCIGLSGSQALEAYEDPIFFWESASEPPQLIDQFLTGLRNSGFLTRVRAMIVGHAIYDEEGRKDRPLNDLLAEVGSALGIPVVHVPTFGHLATENPMIPIGARIAVDTRSQRLELLSPVTIDD